MTIILWILQFIFIPVVSPLFIGIVRKVKAKFQNRQGAGIFQPYRDLWKLFHKDEVISRDASWVFRFAPFIIFTTTIIIGASIPLFSIVFAHSVLSDFLVVIYMLALGTFFLALAGMDAGSAFGGFGSSREMTMASITEGGLLFSVFSLALLAKSTNLFEIADAISLEFAVPVLIAFMAFVIAMLCETARFPFDNPATHLELTMIHEAMILEYSGKRLALIEWASANKFLIFLSLGANLFFPWGIATSASVTSIITSLVVLLAKVLILSLGVAVIESTIAKFRYFRLPDLLFTSFILSVIAIVLII